MAMGVATGNPGTQTSDDVNGQVAVALAHFP
jgi:hypothetical protein